MPGLRLFFLGCFAVAFLATWPCFGACGRPFRRGDANGDGHLDISDGINTLGYLFLGGAEPGCMDAADANDSGALDIADGIFTFSFLFATGKPPPSPGQLFCGPDLTPDDLGCALYQRCPDLSQEAQCDGVDDDCDGAIDEGCPCQTGESRPCGTSDRGECSFGTQTCLDGAWSECQNSVNPSRELCDGLDNDCDGQSDEDFARLGQPCDGKDGDLCAHGTFSCTADGTGLECVNESVTNIVELCDGEDNDCDGEIDEGCECISGATRPCGTSDQGECKLGMQICVEGKWGPCEGNVEPLSEVCDLLDNDCDGVVDNGFDQDGDGFTPCAGDCDDGNSTVNPGMLIDGLDGLDNDCDLQIDEGPITTSFARDIQPILDANCAIPFCHSGTFPSAGLSLIAGAAYGQIVNVPSGELRAMDRIEPVNPAKSYLWHKINNTQLSVGGQGFSMPSGRPLLTEDTRKLIQTWILEGAPE